MEKHEKVKLRGVCTNPLREPIENVIGKNYHDLKINAICRSVRGVLLHLRNTKELTLYDNQTVEIIRCQISSVHAYTLVLICKCNDWPYAYKVILIWILDDRFVYEIINNSREKDEVLAIKCYNEHGGDYYAPLEEDEIDYSNNYVF